MDNRKKLAMSGIYEQFPQMDNCDMPALDKMRIENYDKDNFAPLVGLAVANSGNILSGLGSLFGGGSGEDKSTGQFTNAKNSGSNRPLWFPTKDEMLRASKNWEGHIQKAIQMAYDPNTGTWDWSGNDWKGIVTSSAPIEAVLFKGAGEKFPVNSTVFSIPPIQTAAKIVQSGGVNPDLAPVQQIEQKNSIWLGKNLVWIIVGAIGVFIVGYMLLKK